MDKALKKAAEDEEASSSSSSDSDSSSSSESGFGLKKGGAKPKAKAKGKKATQKEPKEANTTKEPEVANDATDPPVASTAPSMPSERSVISAPGSDKVALTPALLLDRAVACGKALEQFTTWSLYQGVKQKELDSKISKSLDVVSKLGSLAPDENVTAAMESLNSQANTLSHQAELFSALATPSEFTTTLAGNGAMLADIYKAWKPEEANAFLMDMSRRTCDVLISTKGVDATFFKFVTLNRQLWSANGFDLCRVKEIAGSDEEGMLRIATVQQNALNYFIDRLRSVSDGLEGILGAIPKGWTPIAASAPLTWTPVDESLKNDTGIITKSLVDMQRFVACALTSSADIDNKLKTMFKTLVSCTIISARVNLVIKSNAALRTEMLGLSGLRTLWAKVVELAKSALDCNAALLKASELTGALVALEKSLVEKEDITMWKWTAVSGVSDVLGLLEANASELTEEQATLLTMLQDAKTSICRQGPSLGNLLPQMTEFLQAQWKSSTIGEIGSFFTLTSADEQAKDMWHTTSNAGQILENT
eukprot:Skav206981  [mRNA]  locus=scaffold1394:74797:77128:- [translate_table: standard]